MALDSVHLKRVDIFVSIYGCYEDHFVVIPGIVDVSANDVSLDL